MGMRNFPSATPIREVIELCRLLAVRPEGANYQ